MKKINKFSAVMLSITFMLGLAASFSVFAGSAMTADAMGATVSGDLGVNPGLSVSGPWTVGGTSYFGTGGLSGTAKTDATAE